MLWQNALMIGIACITCAFMGTHSLWMALVVGPFTILIAAVGGFFDVMDLTGWTMLITPPVCAFLGAGAGILWRRTHKPVPDFVAPPLSPEQRQRRRDARSKKNKPEDGFKLYGD